MKGSNFYRQLQVIMLILTFALLPIKALAEDFNHLLISPMVQFAAQNHQIETIEVVGHLSYINQVYKDKDDSSNHKETSKIEALEAVAAVSISNLHLALRVAGQNDNTEFDYGGQFPDSDVNLSVIQLTPQLSYTLANILTLGIENSYYIYKTSNGKIYKNILTYSAALHLASIEVGVAYKPRLKSKKISTPSEAALFGRFHLLPILKLGARVDKTYASETDKNDRDYLSYTLDAVLSLGLVNIEAYFTKFEKQYDKNEDLNSYDLERDAIGMLVSADLLDTIFVGGSLSYGYNKDSNDQIDAKSNSLRVGVFAGVSL